MKPVRCWLAVLFLCGCGDAQKDPCEGVVCNHPPQDFCQTGSTQIRYDPAGWCDSSSGMAICQYDYSTVACAGGCSQGICRGDPCEGVTCDQPPADACIDPSTRRTHAQAGTCDVIAGQAVCVYSFDDTDCPHGCEDAACLPDPCTGITCETPPPDECKDADTLIVYDTQGTCDSSSGQAECAYGDTIEPCEFGCDNGICLPDPCIGVTCDDPPADECQDADNLIEYDAQGTCDSSSGQAECVYGTTVTPCEFGCGVDHCEPDPQQRLGINIYVDNFCNMTVDPQEVFVPAGGTALLTYHNLSEWYEVDVWCSYIGGYTDLACGDSWADPIEWCTGDSVYTGYADISTACSSHRLLIHCQ